MTTPFAMLSNDAPRPPRPPLGRGVVLTSITGFWLFYVIIVTLRGNILGFPDFINSGDLFWRRAVVTALGILVTIILWQIIGLFDRRPLIIRIIATVFSAIPCAIAIAAINYFMFNVYDTGSLFNEGTAQEAHATAMVQDVAELAISRYFFLIAWASLYLALGFSNDVAASERQTAAYAKAAQEAELRALRYQLNPHFLFNTLNSLSALVMNDRKAEAEKMIMTLSNFFRASLAANPTEDVRLEEEIALQQLYLDIEKIRFPKRLHVKIDLPDPLRDIAVPALILQPLVENAVKHGVSRSNQSVNLTIAAQQQDGMLVLSIVDDAPLPPSNAEKSAGNGIGLSNVRDRLAARFGPAAKFETHRPPEGGFVATLTIPVTRHA